MLVTDEKSENVTKLVTLVPKTKFKVSDKLFDNDVKSVLSNRGDVATGTIISNTVRVFNTVMEINRLVAVPGLGCGMTIEVELLSNVEQGTNRHNGKWLIKHMTHNFTQHAGKYSYGQELGVVRE